jgi:electron transfer flavoprotein beta subunit
LSWPQGTFASKIEFEDGRVNVTREIDGGLETLSLRLPAVITTDLRLNEPRFISLPNIMQAKKKTIATLPLSDLNVDIKPHLIVKRVTPPLPHRSGIKVNSVSELLQKLKSEARVI